jgi:hypothetical protein
VTRFGKELSANWFKPAAGNLATGLASTAPSFRSSWQSVVNAWRGTSHGANGVEGEEAREAGTTNATPAQDGQAGPFALRASASVQTRLAAQFNAPVSNAPVSSALDKTEIRTQASRLPGEPVQDAASRTASTASTASGTTASSRERVDSASRRASQENTAQTANSGAQTASPATVAPISLVPSSSEVSAQAQTGETTLLPAPATALSDGGSAQASGAGQLYGTDSDLVGMTGTLATGIAGSTGAARGGARTMHTGPASPQRGTIESHAARETAEASLDDLSESATSFQGPSPALSEASSANAQHKSSPARIAAASEGFTGSRAGNLTHPEPAGGGQQSTPADANASDTAQTSAGALQDVSKQSAAPRSTSHNATGEAISTATPVVMAPPASDAGLRTPAAAQVSAAPAADHSQTVASTSTTASDTFSTLDQGTSLGTPAWTHAGGQHAEAGFQDPALGWVGVRADLNAGGVHATLVPSSTDAAQSLSGHLAGLNSHLAEQQAPVASLSMASPGESGADSGMGQRMQQGAESNPQGNAPEESQANLQQSPPPASNSSLAAAAEGGVQDTVADAGNSRGTHISVMA